MSNIIRQFSLVKTRNDYNIVATRKNKNREKQKVMPITTWQFYA